MPDAREAGVLFITKDDFILTESDVYDYYENLKQVQAEMTLEQVKKIQRCLTSDNPAHKEVYRILSTCIDSIETVAKRKPSRVLNPRQMDKIEGAMFRRHLAQCSAEY